MTIREKDTATMGGRVSWRRSRALLVAVCIAVVPASVRGVDQDVSLTRDEDAVLAVVRAIAAAPDSPKPVCVTLLWSENGAIQPSEQLVRRLEREPGVVVRPPCTLRLDVGPVEWTSDSVAFVRAGEPSPVGRCRYRVTRKPRGRSVVSKPPCILE